MKKTKIIIPSLGLLLLSTAASITGTVAWFAANASVTATGMQVKAKTAKAKSLSTALKHPDNYHIFHAIKFGDYNVGREGQLLTLPNYMQFLLDLEPEEIVLDPIDVDAVNALAKIILG